MVFRESGATEYSPSGGIEMQQNKLYVGNLAFTATQSDVESAFSSYGEIDEVRLITDRDTGRSRGFAFVTFSTPAGCRVGTGDERQDSRWTKSDSQHREGKDKRWWPRRSALLSSSDKLALESNQGEPLSSMSVDKATTRPNHFTVSYG